MSRTYEKFEDEPGPYQVSSEPEKDHTDKHNETPVFDELNVLVHTATDNETATETFLNSTSKPMRFFLTLCFNLGPVYIIFPFLCLFDVIQQLRNGVVNKWGYFLCVVFDLLMCCAIIGTLTTFFDGLILGTNQFDPESKLYYNWSLSCILFISIYTIFVTWKECMMRDDQRTSSKEQTFRVSKWNAAVSFVCGLLLSPSNLQAMCLGLYQSEFLKTQRITAAQQIQIYQKSFKTQVEDIIERMGIDKTLVYFSLINEQQINTELLPEPTTPPQTTHRSHRRRNTMHGLKELGFFGTRHIVDDLLLPLYVNSRTFLTVDFKTKSIITMVIILAKVLIPTIVLVSPISPRVIYQSFIFGGFYMHFVSILVLMQLNDDLKTRNYLLSIIKKLIDLQEYMKSRQTTFLIDISCALSLQSWDTLRQMTLQIDRSKSLKYSFLFGFLVLYGKVCFVGYLLCSLNLMTLDYCEEPIVVYNMHVDVVFNYPD